MSKLNGSWKITLHTYMGDMRSTLYATVDGAALTGHVVDAANGADAPTALATMAASACQADG